MRRLAGCLVILSLLQGVSSGEDWPQWLGEKRDSLWNETGVVQRFPEDGLSVKWRVPVAWGYSGPAVADGRVYLMDYVRRSGRVTNNDGRDQLSGTERVLCFDANTGELVWKHEYERPYHLSYPRGPRCTPTILGNRVFALGAEGDLTCLAADTGQLLWSKDLPKQYGTETPLWGYSGHPLVDDNLVFCIVGGDQTLVVALATDSGKEVWRSMSGEPSYCPPTILHINGKKRLFIWDSQRISSLEPGSGTVGWSVSLPPGFGVATAAPRLIGANIFVSSADNVSALINATTGSIVWKGTPKTSMGCSVSTPIVDGETIYGVNDSSGSLIAASARDGTRHWETALPIAPASRRKRGPRHGTAFIVKNDDRYFLFTDSGDLVVAFLSPEGYQEISRFHVLDPTNFAGSRKVVWSHPAFAQRCLFARNDEELVCVSLQRD